MNTKLRTIRMYWERGERLHDTDPKLFIGASAKGRYEGTNHEDWELFLTAIRSIPTPKEV